MSSIPNGAFLAPHSCHDALRKQMEQKRLDRQASTTVTPDGTPPGSPRKYDSLPSPLVNLKNYFWPATPKITQPPQYSSNLPDIINPKEKTTGSPEVVPPFPDATENKTSPIQIHPPERRKPDLRFFKSI